MLGPSGGALGRAFFIFNERTLWASQEARPYALTMLASVAAFAALAKGLRHGRSRDWIAYVAWSLVGLGSQATYPAIFLSQTLIVAGWQIRSKKLRVDWLIATFFFFAVATPMFAWLGGKQTNQAFYGERAWPEFDIYVKGLMQIFWGEYDIVWSSGLKYPGTILTILLAVATLVGMALVSGLAKDVIGGFRYYSVGAGGAALIQGAVIAHLKGPRLKWSVVAACAILNAVTCGAWLYNPGDGAREAVQFVAANRDPAEPVLFCASNPEFIADHYGLSTPVTPVGRTIADPSRLAGIARSAVGGSDSFWVIFYKEKKSPLPQLLEDWTAGKRSPEAGLEAGFSLEVLQEYDEARALCYVRPD